MGGTSTIKMYVGHRIGKTRLQHMSRFVRRVISDALDLENIDSYVMYPARGVYQGRGENATVVEIVDASPEDVKLARGYIQVRLRQESVLVTCNGDIV